MSTMYVRSRVAASIPGRVLYNLADHPGGETTATVIVDAAGVVGYFDSDGREVGFKQDWRTAISEWRTQNPGIWP